MIINKGVLVIPENLTGDDIDLSRQGLAEAMGQGSHVVIDCGMLKELDEHGMVFLCSAHRHALNRGKELVFLNLSKELMKEVSTRFRGFLPKVNCPHSNIGGCLWP